jgi:hypothetical protein
MYASCLLSAVLQQTARLGYPASFSSAALPILQDIQTLQICGILIESCIVIHFVRTK